MPNDGPILHINSLFRRLCSGLARPAIHLNMDVDLAVDQLGVDTSWELEVCRRWVRTADGIHGSRRRIAVVVSCRPLVQR